MPSNKWLYLAAGIALGMYVVPKVMSRIGG